MPEHPPPHVWIPSAAIRQEVVVPRGGGDTYVRDDHATHSRALLDAFSRSLADFTDKNDFDIATDLIVEIAMAADRPAAKERQHLRNLGFEVIALSPEAPNVAIARLPRDGLESFQRKLERYANTPKHRGKSNLAAIESITPVATARKLEPMLAEAASFEAQDCLITLYSGLPADMKNRVASRIAESLGSTGHEETRIHSFTNGIVGVSARLTLAEMNRVSEQFMFVRTIESNAEVLSESAVQADAVPTILQVDAPKCTMPVAVIDSGINATSALLAGLVVNTISELPAGSVGPHMAHGTFVASRVIYGDDITAVLSRRASPWCPVIDVQVTGVDRVGAKVPQNPATLGEILERVVPTLSGETKVFNLSLGISPISDGFYSSLARIIDHLARLHGVLFVISAGNINDPCAVPPAHFTPEHSRILFPAESLLSLTVGATARYCEPGCVAQEREVAPYSRRGPGADRALKPELAAHGGNVHFNGSTWSTSPRIAAYGLGMSGTHLEYATGTSYSAPLVSQYAARLFDAYPGAHPNLVRALLCHFANPVGTPALTPPLAGHHLCGFGEPDVDRALYSSRSAVTYLYQGSIRKDTYQFVPFYVPASIAQSHRARLVVRGTIVFDPPVSADDSVNYSLCRIAGQLRKQTLAGPREVQIGGAEDDVLYPWNPLVHFARSFRRSYTHGDWELRLRLMTRGELPEDFTQTFAVVIEVLDASGGTRIRDSLEIERPGVYIPVSLRLAA